MNLESLYIYIYIYIYEMNLESFQCFDINYGEIL
jgi:hypothetical protein